MNIDVTLLTNNNQYIPHRISLVKNNLGMISEMVSCDFMSLIVTEHIS